MILRLAGFAPYTTAFQPAAGLWTAYNDVQIVPGGGRSGSADDNCARFSTEQSSFLSLTVNPGAVLGLYTATYGLAVRFLSLTTSATIASIWTADSKFDLVVLATGVVRLTQTYGGVLLGTVCESTASVVPIGDGGVYLECQIIFQGGLATACQIRASDQYGDMNPLAAGPQLRADAGPFTTFRLGGGISEAAAVWHVADVYLNDGIPAATPIESRGQLIYNNSFLGNTHITTFYPTADGTALTTGNTPWVPDTGTEQYSRINEHPPDEDTSYLTADETSQTSTFSFQSPYPRPFGRLNCEAFAYIFGIQWDGRLRNEGLSANIAPIVRLLVGGTLATDVVEQGDAQLIDSESYLYYPDVFDRNPVDGNRPWTFDVFYPALVGARRTTELGIRLL